MHVNHGIVTTWKGIHCRSLFRGQKTLPDIWKKPYRFRHPCWAKMAESPADNNVFRQLEAAALQLAIFHPELFLFVIEGRHTGGAPRVPARRVVSGSRCIPGFRSSIYRILLFCALWLVQCSLAVCRYVLSCVLFLLSGSMFPFLVPISLCVFFCIVAVTYTAHLLVGINCNPPSV